ncbi:MAG: hypothetical protein KDD25_01575 [Bdellovibrionales bacterium]|nr:hypothetical protein [Bdellovibrionales bacterium]
MTILQPGKNQTTLIPSDEFDKLKGDLVSELKPAVSVIRAITSNSTRLTEKEREVVVRSLEQVERILFDLENQL